VSELALHLSIGDTLRLLARPGVVWWHVSNGEKRDKQTAAKLKRMGVLPGVSDLTISLPGGRFGFLELKWNGNRLTPEQHDFLAAMAERGHLTGVAYTLDSALIQLASWGAIRPISQPISSPNATDHDILSPRNAERTL